MSLECWVYRSPRKEEMYLYLSTEGDFSCLPAELLRRFGTPVQIMQLSLHEGRKLAREDVTQVMYNLRTLGYHLQMPPMLRVDLYEGE